MQKIDESDYGTLLEIFMQIAKKRTILIRK